MRNDQIFGIYGDSPKEMVKKILSMTNVEREIGKNALIGIKPNLVLDKPSTSGATTSPQLVEGVIEYLYDKGFKNIIILEGSWVGAKTSEAFKVCGYTRLSKEYGIPLIDLQKDSFDEVDSMGVKIKVCRKAMEVDYLINMPVLKGHCQTKMTCALKNIKGCIPDREKRRFHTMGLHTPIAHLNDIVKSSLVIVDGIMGDLCFEEGGTPVEMNRIIVGKDPVLIDSYVAEIMGYDINEIPYITIAKDIGVGSTDINNADILEINKANKIQRIKPSRSIEGLTKYIEDKDSCSACYGSLVHALKRIEDMGMLRGINKKIYIGQGYKEQSLDGIGIGICVTGASNALEGCPPKAKNIVEHILRFVADETSP